MINPFKFMFRFSLWVVVLLFVGATAMAQSTATLQGTVKDQKGDVVAGAKVTARNQGTAIERTTQTDSDGNYQLASLPVGDYSVQIEMQGFKRQLLSNLTIEVGRTVVRDFSLEVGGLEQSVTVTGETSVIESATVSVGQVINQRTV